MLECIMVSIGWDPAPDLVPMDATELDAGAPDVVSGRADLNIAALSFSGDQLVDAVYHENLTSLDGSVRHTGDNLTGEGAGDNEVIVADLSRIADQVTSVFLVITSYTARTFADVPNAYCHIVDAGSTLEIARYSLTGGPHTAVVVGKLARDPRSWEFTGIGLGVAATHVAETVGYLGPYLP